jgi:hypothetical protein
MMPWIAQEITEIINMSLEIGKFPKRWKIARVKPMYKGGGCERQAPKSYRPVALLSATSESWKEFLHGSLTTTKKSMGSFTRGCMGLGEEEEPIQPC